MKKIYHEVIKCRACGNRNLTPILSLGEQSLTGVFPKTKEQDVGRGPLELVKCDDRSGDQFCGLFTIKASPMIPALCMGKDTDTVHP